MCCDVFGIVTIISNREVTVEHNGALVNERRGLLLNVKNENVIYATGRLLTISGRANALLNHH
jgi:hypothetical protein